MIIHQDQRPLVLTVVRSSERSDDVAMYQTAGVGRSVTLAGVSQMRRVSLGPVFPEWRPGRTQTLRSVRGEIDKCT